MLNRVFLNGVLMEAADASISPLAEGFLYGRGLYETVRLTGGKPAFMSDHGDRMRMSAAKLGLVWNTTDSELADRALALAAANGASDAVLKIVLFEDAKGTGELILTRDYPYPLDNHIRAFKLKSVRVGARLGELHSLKTLNQLPNVLPRAAARAEGWDDALFHDSSGAVYECAATNIFAVIGAVAKTPPLDGCVLPGVARSKVLQLSGCARFEEAPLTLAQVLAAEEVFVTNSLVGAMPVSRIDGREFDVAANPVTRAVMEAFRSVERESILRLG
jgi:branched-subunit amino acid aminotransferase/4-amino-4-deoxychorismate lyase